jgi:hypothetical protein
MVPWDRGVSTWVVVLLVVAAAGCGSGRATESTAAGSTTTTWPSLFEVEASVVSVDRVVDDLHLTVTLGDVPSGGAGCDVTVVDRTKDNPDQSPVDAIRPVVMLSRADREPFAPTFDGTWPGCELGTRPVEIELLYPFAGRPVIVVQPVYALWTPQADGTFSRCELPGCDPVSGQPPDPAGCDRTLYDAVRAGDVPAHSRIDVRGCAGGYAVVDIDLGSGACGATEERPNPCAGKRVDRTFWSRQGRSWTLVTFGKRGVPGCANASLPPEFPRELCDGLPAVPNS